MSDAKISTENSAERKPALPMMARLSYQREILSWWFVPLMLSGLQGGTIAVFLKKTYAGLEGISTEQLDLAVSIVAASKAIGHIVSYAWASVSRGQRKIQFIFWLQLFTAVVVAAFALVPRSSGGLWMIVGLCVMAWTLWCGVITLRTGVWSANYAKAHRPRIAGRIMTIDALLVALAGVLIGFGLDINPMSYRIIFPLLAMFGVVGAILYRRIPFRRESQHIARERKANAKHGSSLSPMVVARVLRGDSWYRGYMACMFTMGFGNLMLHPILAIALTDQFDVGYQTGILITTVIPLVCLTLTISSWGRRLERMHVIEFRALHAWSFVVVSTLVLIGVAFHQIAFLYLAAVATGVGWGGGALAWNLGHQHFAPPNRDAEYMGVHITLTGIRGVIGPIVGVQLYTVLSRYGWQQHALLLCFAVCLLMNILGASGFVWLAAARRREKRRSRDQESAVDTAGKAKDEANEKLVAAAD